MSENSPRLDLPYVQPAQAQKHVTVNEAFQSLDMLVQLTVAGFDETTPPALPQEGEIHALGDGALGVWAGHDGELAQFTAGAWRFRAPGAGWLATQAGSAELRVWTGAAWEVPDAVSFDNLPGVGINTAADATNRLAVSSPATLLSHEGAGHQLKINKAGAGDTASLLFQDGWSGRAEMGLAGDDDFRIKVSADGSAWTEALRVDAASGAVALNRAAVATLDLASLAGTFSADAADIFLYDTSKDSDGGAWRQRTQGTSWYQEALNTATRGKTRPFPAVAVIVAEAGKVTIFDATDPALPMWMVIPFVVAAPVLITCIAALNGKVEIGSDTGGSIGLTEFDFVADGMRAFYSFGNKIASAGIAFRPSNLTDWNALYSGSYSGAALVNSAVNDVAMTVLPGAPVDPATGLLVPTVAVATEGGVSVLRDDGTVVSDSSTQGATVAARLTGFTTTGQLLRTWGADYRRVGVYTAGIPAASSSSNTGWMAFGDLATGLGPTYTLGSNGSGIVAQRSNGIGWGTNLALNLLAAGTGNAASMVHYLTSTWISGWLPGAVKGAWLASTDASSLIATELVTNGTFDTDISGWTAVNATLAATSGQLAVTNSVAGQYGFAYQGLATVVGKTYAVSIGVSGASTNWLVRVGDDTTGSTNQKFQSTGTTGAATITRTFVATAATTYVRVGVYNTTSGQTATFDNISVKVADADRSVNGNGLTVTGTITRAPVAAGAELAGYSGFGAANYLSQPYNAALDFGTGDFCVMGWVKTSEATRRTLLKRQDAVAGANYLYIRKSAAGAVEVLVNGGVVAIGASVNIGTGQWVHVAVLRSAGVISVYVNGKQDGAATAETGSLTYSTGSATWIGVRDDGAEPWAGSLALVRISATAPSADQIAKIYRDELALFQPGAACTLYGASGAVTALAHDPGTGLLHIGTGAGRSDFAGLRRVGQSATGVTTAIAAVGGAVVEQ